MILKTTILITLLLINIGSTLAGSIAMTEVNVRSFGDIDPFFHSITDTDSNTGKIFSTSNSSVSSTYVDAWAKGEATVNKGNITANASSRSSVEDSNSIVKANWSDNIQLSSASQIELPSFITVELKVQGTYIDGLNIAGFSTLNVEVGDKSAGSTSFVFDNLGNRIDDVSGDWNTWGTSVSITDPFPIAPFVFEGTIKYDFAINDEEDYFVNWGLELISHTSFEGEGTSSAITTANLLSITMPDGSTPESNGFNIAFDSGAESPNMSAVPLPASIWLFGSVIFCFFGSRRRH